MHRLNTSFLILFFSKQNSLDSVFQEAYDRYLLTGVVWHSTHHRPVAQTSTLLWKQKLPPHRPSPPWPTVLSLQAKSQAPLGLQADWVLKVLRYWATSQNVSCNFICYNLIKCNRISYRCSVRRSCRISCGKLTRMNNLTKMWRRWVAQLRAPLNSFIPFYWMNPDPVCLLLRCSCRLQMTSSKAWWPLHASLPGTESRTLLK